MASKANSWLPAAGAPRCPWPASTLPVGADFFNSFHDGVDAVDDQTDCYSPMRGFGSKSKHSADDQDRSISEETTLFF
uniref:Uncharacterized protein n=1 Tax=Oryza barthii TaxID=65489 RepID=A0A0D3GDG6_9ORYZ